MKTSLSDNRSSGFYSIRWRFLALCTLLVTLPTVVMGIWAYQTSYREIIQASQRDLQLIVDGWHTVTDVYYAEYQRILRRERYLVEKRLSSVAFSVGQMVSFVGRGKAAESAFFERVAGIEMGRSGRVVVLDRSGEPLSSLDEQGAGNVEAMLELPEDFRYEIVHAAHGLKGGGVGIVEFGESGIKEGRIFVAAVFSVPERGWIIAAIMSETDFKSADLERILQEEVKDKIASQKVGKRGYLWVVDGEGVFLVSKDRLRDGEKVEDVWGLRDLRSSAGGIPDRSFVMRRIVARAIGERNVHPKLIVFSRCHKWGWVIGATVYEEELLRGLRRIRRQIMDVCMMFILFGGLLAWFFSTLITRPLRRLEAVAATGSLNAIIGEDVLSSRDEIGSLAITFDNMMRHLREKISE
ncbi:MAG: HAMP domain-containing protein, partial [Elusimicrobia bacterium]|nr:HAMP domain-containing protein [Elusimicrobiota bacterium]